MASGDSSNADRPARPFQFTLRHLLLVMGVCSVFFALFFYVGTAAFLLSFGLVCIGVMAWGAYTRTFGLVLAGFCSLCLGLSSSALVDSRPPARRASCQS